MPICSAKALFLICLLPWLASCVRVGFEQSGRDGGVQERAWADRGAADSAKDAATSDRSPADGAGQDSGPADGGGQDSGSVDGGGQETGSVDGGGQETGSLDGGGQDTRSDSVSSDLTTDSASADSSASRRLVCGSTVIVGNSQPANLSSPSVTPDGLRLVGENANRRYTATRPDLDANFGAWSTYVDPWAATTNKSDYAFFQHGGGMHAIVAIPGTDGDRSLHDCPHTASTCSEILIYGPSSSLLTGNADLDGPSVTTGLEMLISVDITGEARAIYRATPRDGTLGEWDAAPLIVSPTSSTFDDGSIAGDGSLIVFPDVFPSPARILYTFRGPDSGYGSIQQLTLDTADPSSPAIFLRPDSSYELFFDDATAGIVYVTRCL